jgi:DNA-directed RNA polymerase subunit RPC12/RpoP
MKVIKHGNVNKIKVCGSCQCEFEYDNNDIQMEAQLYSTIAVSYRYVICPDCGAKIYIDQETLTLPSL